MNLIVYLIVGGIIGWLASLLLRIGTQQGIILNIIVGVIGGVTLSLVTLIRVLSALLIGPSRRQAGCGPASAASLGPGL